MRRKTKWPVWCDGFSSVYRRKMQNYFIPKNKKGFHFTLFFRAWFRSTLATTGTEKDGKNVLFGLLLRYACRFYNEVMGLHI